MNALRNKVQLIGNIGADPEVKTIGSDRKFAKFSIATNESYRNQKGEKVQETQWHNVVAWGKLAGLVEQLLAKGRQVMIEGKLTTRTYEDKSGTRKYVTEVVASELLLLGPKSN